MIYIVYLLIQEIWLQSAVPGPVYQTWVGSCLAVSHLNLFPVISAAWTSPAQVRFSVIICLYSAPQLSHFSLPTLLEKSSSVETNEFLLQYRHRNFRYKRSLWGFFVWVDSFSNCVFSIAVLQVAGSIFWESASLDCDLLWGVAFAGMNGAVMCWCWVVKYPRLPLSTYRSQFSSLSSLP